MRNWISSLYTWNQYIISQLHSNIKLKVSLKKKKKAYIWNDKCKNSQQNDMSGSKNSSKDTSKF